MSNSSRYLLSFAGQGFERFSTLDQAFSHRLTIAALTHEVVLSFDPPTTGMGDASLSKREWDFRITPSTVEKRGKVYPALEVGSFSFNYYRRFALLPGMHEAGFKAQVRSAFKSASRRPAIGLNWEPIRKLTHVTTKSPGAHILHFVKGGTPQTLDLGMTWCDTVAMVMTDMVPDFSASEAGELSTEIRRIIGMQHEALTSEGDRGFAVPLWNSAGIPSWVDVTIPDCNVPLLFEDPFEEKKFEIEVSRSVSATRRVTVMAKDPSEAAYRAVTAARDLVFNSGEDPVYGYHSIKQKL